MINSKIKNIKANILFILALILIILTCSPHTLLKKTTATIPDIRYYFDTSTDEKVIAGEYTIGSKSFESNLISPWTFAGESSATITSEQCYYGYKSCKIIKNNTSLSVLSQTLTCGTGVSNDNSPDVGENVEAGVWAYFNSDIDFSSGNFYIQIKAYNASMIFLSTVVTSAALSISTSKNLWLYIKTNSASIPVTTAFITVSIQNTLKGTVYVDFIQAGEANKINGNPGKLAIGVLQPWYGNHFDGWDNWGVYGHNPDNPTTDAPRDLASVYYPYTGAYDSLNDLTVVWQIYMAKAMMINCLMIDYYYNKTRHHDVISKFIQQGESRDIKISLLYETRGRSVAGIEIDLINLLNKTNASGIKWVDSKAYLKNNGKPVIGVFGMQGTTTSPLTSTDWDDIENYIFTNSGIDCILIGDSIPSGTWAAFSAMFNWSLYDNSISAGSSPTTTTVYNWSRDRNNDTKAWAAASPTTRFPIMIVWPGFNDYAVQGWGGYSYPYRVTPFWYSTPPTFYDEIILGEENARNINCNWVLIATMNDWNESTAIEPSKEQGYTNCIKTQNFLKTFKGASAADNNKMQEITENFMQYMDFK